MKGKGKGKQTGKEKGNDSNNTPNEQHDWYKFYCDKCGGMFSSEFELDHHDKTDH